MAISESDLRSELYDQFPEIRADLDEECLQGLHLEVASLARWTQNAITEGDRAALKRAFFFADRMLRLGDSSVKNAVSVSFLENLSFEDTKKRRRSWAFEMMTPVLQQEHHDLEDYLRALHDRKPGR